MTAGEATNWECANDIGLIWESHNNEKVPMFLWQSRWIFKQQTGRFGLSTAGIFKSTGLLH